MRSTLFLVLVLSFAASAQGQADGEGDFRTRLESSLRELLKRGLAPSETVAEVGRLDPIVELCVSLCGDREVAAEALAMLRRLPAARMPQLRKAVLAAELSDSRVRDAAVLTLLRGLERDATKSSELRESLGRLMGDEMPTLRWLGLMVSSRRQAEHRTERYEDAWLAALDDAEPRVQAEAQRLLLRSPSFERSLDDLARRSLGEETAGLREALWRRRRLVLPAWVDVARKDQAGATRLRSFLTTQTLGDRDLVDLLPLFTAAALDDWRSVIDPLRPELKEEADAKAVLRALAFDPRLDAAMRDALLRGGRSGAARELAPLLTREPAAARRRFDELEALNRRDALASLQHLINGSDARVAAAALCILAEDGTPLALPQLLRRLEDPDGDLALASALALARVGEPRSFDALRRIVRGDGQRRAAALAGLREYAPRGMAAAVSAVMATGDRRALRSLLEDLREKGGRIDRELGIELVTKPHFDRRDAKWYYQLFRDCGDDQLRRGIAEALISGRVPDPVPALDYVSQPVDPKLRDLLAGFLNEESGELRRAALAALRGYSLEGLEEPVGALVRDPEAATRVALAELLENNAGAASTGSLVVLSKDTDWVVREAAVQSLAKHEGPPVKPALKQRLGDGSRGVANAALISLVIQREYADLGRLFNQVDDPVVGERTRRFLGQHFGVKLENAEAWSEWWDKEGRFQVRQS